MPFEFRRAAITPACCAQTRASAVGVTTAQVNLDLSGRQAGPLAPQCPDFPVVHLILMWAIDTRALSLSVGSSTVGETINEGSWVTDHLVEVGLRQQQ